MQMETNFFVNRVIVFILFIFFIYLNKKILQLRRDIELNSINVQSVDIDGSTYSFLVNINI